MSTTTTTLEPFLVPLDGQAAVLRALIEPVLDGQGLELVQLQLGSGASRATLRLFVDTRPGAGGTGDGQPGAAVSMAELERANRVVGDFLDVEDAHRGLFRGRYDLEVSSPGVDRPLTKKSHFARFAGEQAKVRTRAPVAGSRAHAGVLGPCSDKGVVVGDVLVPWGEIVGAHIVFQFETAQRPKPKRAKKSQRQPQE